MKGAGSLGQRPPAHPVVSAGSGVGEGEPTRLSILDRYLTWWIAAAMLGGLAMGHFLPTFSRKVISWLIPGTPVPVALGGGLILMMYPPFARVKYEELRVAFQDVRLLLLSLAQNWLIGPFLMFALAVVLLRNYPGLMVGLILIGSARCIAMVLVWNEIAGGSREYAAGLMAFNSLFQVFFYGAYIYFFVAVFLPWIGLGGAALSVSFSLVALSVILFLGVPLTVGVLTRSWFVGKGRKDEYDRRLAPSFAPAVLLALLYTIVIMFASQSEAILGFPQAVLYVAIPLLFYFLLMFLVSFYSGLRAGAGYEKTASLSLTAASNNFELAITVAIALFGVTSGEALSATVGPLVEVPVMLVLVGLSRWLGPRLFASPGQDT